MNSDQVIETLEPASPAWAKRAMLPPRHQTGRPVSSAPMNGSAELAFDDNGNVAWDQIWDDFCDLALAGGPPHRETMLLFSNRDDIVDNRGAYERVVVELLRAIGMVTGWPTRRSTELGRFELVCPDEEAALWLEEAVNAENVRAIRDGIVLQLPSGADFQIKMEIRNVVTAVAKAHHYWAEHRASLDEIRRRSIAGSREFD